MTVLFGAAITRPGELELPLRYRMTRFLFLLLLSGALSGATTAFAQADENEAVSEETEEAAENGEEVAESEESTDESEDPEEEPVGEESGGEDESAEEVEETVPTTPYEPAEEPSSGPRTMCQGRRIEAIRVEGTRRVDPDDIRAAVDLRAGVPCTDAEVARDARSLWELGFFDDLAFEAAPNGRGIDLIIRVQERPVIARVVFEGNDEVDDDDIDEKVRLEDGAILSEPDVRSQITRIRDLYAEEGFFLARVEYELRRLENDNNEVEVRFNIDEGPEVTVRRIRFVGNRNIPADDLSSIMATSELGFFSFLSDNAHYQGDNFEDDIQRLQAYYYDQGYLMMRVGAPRIELTADRAHIDITIPITEGPRFRVGEFVVRELNSDGQEVDALEDDLRDRIDLDQGEYFSRTKIALGLQEITRVYRDQGYARVEVTPGTDLEEDERIVNLSIDIQRGPPVRIERINIRGNTKTRDSVLRREMMVMEGELYSQTLVERSKARIEALGYFERVDLSEETGSSPDRIILNIEVSERPTGTFQVGAGFSSIESFLITAQIQQQNLFGNGQSLQLQLQLSGIRQNVDIRFFEPWFFGSRWSFGLDLFLRTQQFQDFNQISRGAGFNFGHPIFDPRFRVSLGYRIEGVSIGARTGGPLNFGTGGQGFGIFRRVPLANLFRVGRTSSLRATVSWDSRNNRLFPTNGWYALYSLEFADRAIGSEQVFTRQTGFVRFYRQIAELGEGRPLVFKVNTQFGLISSRDPRGVPIYERFFLGGIFNVRGYPLNTLGPRASIPRGTDPNASPPAAGNGFPEGVSFGGNLQLYYQAELEVPILPEIGIRGVVFADGGNVWNLEDSLCQAPETASADATTSPCGFNPLAIRTSVGFGFRWFSPLGPLRFEFGIPLARRSHEQPIRFEFTIGNSF